jgi:hypothetical protein
MTFALTLILVGGFVFFLAVIACVPRLLLRPKIRSELWLIRDELYDARRHGQLPTDDAASHGLVSRIEAATEAADLLTAGRVLFASRLYRKESPETKTAVEAMVNPDLSHLSQDERALYCAFDRRFKKVVVLTPFLGSWLGLACLAVGTPIVGIWALVSVFSGRAESQGRRVLSETRIQTEEVAIELRSSRFRPHSIAV